MQIDQVEAFMAVVRGGGFTRAAATLQLSQPAVSRRLELLERELGAPLFERVRSGVLLTEAGRTFLPYAESVLASVRDGLDAVGALERADQGTITLALVGTLASTTLTACLERFRAAHPRVDLRIRTALSSEVSAIVRRGDSTLGLRYEADPDPEMLCTPVYAEPMVPVASPRHRLARARRLAPAALEGEAWIGFPERSRPPGQPEPYSSALKGRLAASGLGHAEIIPIDSLSAQKRMVEAGFGLALLPESSVNEELRTGTLRALPVRAMETSIEVVLIHRRRAYLSGAARRMIEELRAWPARRPTRRAAAGAVRRG